jgi:type II secretory pathway pseudopilin PulG
MISAATSRAKQDGYILLVLLLMVAMLMLAVTAVAPRIAQQAKRDRENEMIHRGAEYARAIKRFYRKFGRYPTSLDQLKDTNHLRFLRKAYADPMTQDGKWKLLHPGDVKIGGANVGTPVSSLASKTQPSALSSTSPTGAPAQGLSSPSTTTASGATNQQFGGMIIGVASTSEQEGIHEFDGKSKYNEWYFVYDPTTDRGGLISGPYTGKTFANGGTAIPGATPAGQQPGGFGRPMGGLGQPSNQGGFGQPMGGIGQPPPKQ